MKIVLHGFGTYPIVFRHLIAAARKTAPQLDWAVILPTPHHRELMRELVADENVLSLQDHLSRDIRPLEDLSELRSYPGNIFSDIEAEKRAFKHRPASQQLARAAEIYRIYKEFLQRSGASHLVVPQIEGFEGRMLPDLARELGIDVMVPTGIRMAAGTFFSNDAHETLPTYRRVTPSTLDAARAFLARYRAEDASPSGLSGQIDPDDPVLSDFAKRLPARTWGYLKNNFQRPDLFEPEYLRISLLNNIPWFRDSLWSFMRQRAQGQFDIASLDQLPSCFIYYPLQVTPESSINTPAPYFVDQLRAIDAIRFAMPNDHVLVIKEHPSAIVTRPPSFVRALRKRAGVTVVHYRTDSRAIVERAALTISVTGTATMEAFLLGRPSLTLGSSLIAEYLGGVCPIDNLSTRIKERSEHPPSDEYITHAIAEIFSIAYDFVLRPPGLPGEPSLRRGNIDRMLAAILDHASRKTGAARDVTQ